MCVSFDKRAHLPALIVVFLFAYATKLIINFRPCWAKFTSIILLMPLDVDESLYKKSENSL